MDQRRRWCSWHVSSISLSCFWLVGFILIAVPGASGDYVAFGWPYVHYVRCDKSSFVQAEFLQEAAEDWVLRATVNRKRPLVPASPGTSLVKNGFWSDPGNWSYTRPGSAGVWLWAGLAANGALGLGSSLLVGAVWEFRRRRRSSLWQLRLADLLTIPVLLGAVLGPPQFGVGQQRRDVEHLSKMSEEFPEVVDVGFGMSHRARRASPLWLTRLSDERIDELDVWLIERKLPSIIDMVGRPIPVTELTIRGTPGFDEVPKRFDPSRLASRMNELPELESLCCVLFNSEQLELLSFLGATRIQSLHVSATFGDGAVCKLEILSRFERLRQLELSEIDLESDAFPQPSLEHVEELTVSADKLGERSLAWIARLPKLRVLYLRANYEVKNLEEIRARVRPAHVSVYLIPWGGGSGF